MGSPSAIGRHRWGHLSVPSVLRHAQSRVSMALQSSILWEPDGCFQPGDSGPCFWEMTLPPFAADVRCVPRSPRCPPSGTRLFRRSPCWTGLSRSSLSPQVSPFKDCGLCPCGVSGHVYSKRAGWLSLARGTALSKAWASSAPCPPRVRADSLYLWLAGPLSG